MCTVILAFQAFEPQSVRIAANRDEQLDRPAEPFSMRDTTPRVFAPRDVVAGGTWIGVNEHGLVSAITNRFGTSPDPSRRSRGELVDLALGYSSVDDALERLSRLDPTAYNGFHLTVASLSAAYTIWSDGAELNVVERSPGIYVISERSFGAADSPREAWLYEQIESVSEPADLDDLLLHEASDGFNGTLVTVPEMNYGTRSSTIVGLSPTDAKLRHAHGRPDEVPYTDLSNQFASLLGR